MKQLEERILEIEIPADLKETPRLREILRSAMLPMGFDPDTLYLLTLASTEAIVNAIEHGAPKGSQDKIRITLCKDGQVMKISVWSPKTGWQVPEDIEPEALALRGRGFFLMRRIMDEVVVEQNEKGTVVLLKKRLPEGKP